MCVRVCVRERRKGEGPQPSSVLKHAFRIVAAIGCQGSEDGASIEREPAAPLSKRGSETMFRHIPPEKKPPDHYSHLQRPCLGMCAPSSHISSVAYVMGII